MDGPWADYAAPTAPTQEAGPWQDYQPASRHFKVSTATGKALEFDAPQDATDEQIGGIARDQLKQKFGGDYAPAVRGAPEPKSLPETFLDSTKNAVAGVGQGLAAIPDAAANALSGAVGAGIYYGGHGLGALADMAGRDDIGNSIRSGADAASEPFRHPVTIGGAIESAVPTPGDLTGKVVRYGSMFAAPQGSVNALAKGIVGDVPKAVNALSEGQQVARAAERQGVEVLPADVGGATTRKATAGIVQTPLGAGPIIAKAKSAVGSFLARRNALAGEVGNVSDNVGAGEAAQKGAQDFISRTETKGGKLYDSIPITGAREASLGNSKVALDELTAGLESNPELSKSIADGRLARWRAAIAGTSKEVPTGLLDANGKEITRTVQEGGKLSWQDLKAFRSYVGELIGRPTLQDSTAKGDLQRLYGALSSDMEATAKSVGPDASRAFSRANDFWRARQARIDNVMTAVLGKDMNKKPEAAFDAIQRWAGNSSGDIRKLNGLFRSLPKDEADTVRATVIQGLGTARKGAQNAAGDAFSPAEFLTNWNNLSPRAKAILFQGSHRAALDDLATVAGGMKDAAKYANHSNTAGANAVGNLINAGAASGIVLGGVKTAVLSALSLGGQYAAGKILSSEALVRQLTRVASAPSNAAASAAVKGLSVIASREPSLAPDIAPLQQHLMKALNDNMQKAAASGENKEDDRK